MSELRDDIAFGMRHPFDYVGRRALADDLLNLPELQAIRKALLSLHTARVVECGHNGADEWLRAINLPPSVVAWVLDGET